MSFVSRNVRIILAINILITGHLLAANEVKVLPRGNAVKIKNAIDRPPEKKETSDCLNYIANPNGQIGYFDVRNDFFYFASKSQKKDANYKYNINRINLKNHNLETLASIFTPEIHAITPYGKESKGLSAIIFDQASLPCKSGSANYITVSLTKTEATPRVLKGKDEIELALTAENLEIYMKAKNSYLEFDFSSFQSRLMPAELRPHEKPLFIDKDKRLQYVWKFPESKEDSNFGLIAYKNNKDIAANLKFIKGDKVLQFRNLFAVLSADKKNNSLTINEIKLWSGVNENKSYTINIPASNKVADAEIDANFPTKKAIIMGYSKDLKKRWRKSYLFDYEKQSKPIETFLPKNTIYISYGGISFDGTQAFFVTSNLKTDLDERLVIYNFQTKRWKSLTLKEKGK